jgi:hypothetical protein
MDKKVKAAPAKKAEAKTCSTEKTVAKTAKPGDKKCGCGCK